MYTNVHVPVQMVAVNPSEIHNKYLAVLNPGSRMVYHPAAAGIVSHGAGIARVRFTEDPVCEGRHGESLLPGFVVHRL